MSASRIDQIRGQIANLIKPDTKSIDSIFYELQQVAVAAQAKYEDYRQLVPVTEALSDLGHKLGQFSAVEKGEKKQIELENKLNEVNELLVVVTKLLHGRVMAKVTEIDKRIAVLQPSQSEVNDILTTLIHLGLEAKKDKNRDLQVRVNNSLANLNRTLPNIQDKGNPEFKRFVPGTIKGVTLLLVAGRMSLEDNMEIPLSPTNRDEVNAIADREPPSPPASTVLMRDSSTSSRNSKTSDVSEPSSPTAAVSSGRGDAEILNENKEKLLAIVQRYIDKLQKLEDKARGIDKVKNKAKVKNLDGDPVDDLGIVISSESKGENKLADRYFFLRDNLDDYKDDISTAKDMEDLRVCHGSLQDSLMEVVWDVDGKLDIPHEKWGEKEKVSLGVVGSISNAFRKNATLNSDIVELRNDIVKVAKPQLQEIERNLPGPVQSSRGPSSGYEV